MNKQELLDKAVHELKGVLPEIAICEVEEGQLYCATHKVRRSYGRGEGGAIISSISGFQQRARELGYGVEVAEPESWYCYETQKALRLPPVGVECEYNNSGKWIKCKLVFAGKHRGMIEKNNGDEQAVTFEHCLRNFRSLDWNRKAEAERDKVVDAAYNAIATPGGIGVYDALLALHDAGYLRLPADKS